MDRRLTPLLLLALTATLGCKNGSSSEGSTPSADAAAPPPPSAAPSAPPVLADLNGFEGEIDVIAQSGDVGKPTQNVKMFVKGDKIRLDSIPGTETAKTFGRDAYLLVRVADKKLDVVVDSRKEVVELDVSNPDTLRNAAANAGGRPKQAVQDKDKEPPPKVVKTGKKEQIAGYTCEDWEITSAKDQKKKQAVCVADLASSFFHIPLTGLPNEYGFAAELTDGHHFPLRVILYDDRTGAESGRLEVKKFDPRPLDASRFEIPAGYNVIDLAQAMASALGRIPGMPPGLPSGIPNLPNVPNGPHSHKPHH